MAATVAPPAPRDPVDRGGLCYPHGDAVPAPGALMAVAEGIFWLRMPLPFSLDHINLWVLDGGDHWAIVDTGVALPAVKAHWRALLAGPLAGRPVGRILVTHYHPDHLGLAGWLATKFDLPIEMSRAEFLLARTLTLDVAPQTPPEVVRFYAAHGWPDAALETLRRADWGRFGRAIHRLPTGYRRLREGDVLAIGGRRWTVVIGSGHSPEHACLFEPDERILIAGDQVLPRITSNVSVYPTEPGANPLADWLASIKRLKARLPADTLVLPAHNEPFRGLHARLDQLDADHRRKLDGLLGACTEPLSAWDSFGILFRRPVGDDEIQMATGEALAHLHWLAEAGQIERLETAAQIRFRRC